MTEALVDQHLQAAFTSSLVLGAVGLFAAYRGVDAGGRGGRRAMRQTTHDSAGARVIGA